MNKLTKCLLAISCAFLTACGNIDNAVSRTIAGTVTMTPEWTVVALDPPLEPLRSGQIILIILPDVADWTKPEGSLVLKDGSTIDIKVELRDLNGEKFSMVPVSMGSKIGFGLSNPEEMAGFRKNRKFDQIRFSSSKPIRAKKIEWYCWEGK